MFGRIVTRPARVVAAASALLLLLILTPIVARATTWYVASTGVDTNPGTSALPFRQIRQALTVVQPGDTVLVGDGSYLGFTANSISGTAAAPITIQAQGLAADVTVTTDRSDNRDTIEITYCSYIVIDGLNAFDANRSAVRIDNSPNITIMNGVFGDNTTWGIFTDFSNNTLLLNNTCYGSVQQHGIYVSNSSQQPIIQGNICYGNAGCGIQINADLSQGPPGLTEGAVIQYNVCYGNGASGGAAINLDGVQNSVVVNNLLYDNSASGIVSYYADGAAGPVGMLIAHNTVVMANPSRWALVIEGTAGPNTVRNNILNNPDTNSGGVLYGDSTDVANTDSDYNIQDRVTPDGGNTVYTLAQWQAMGYEPHSFSSTSAALFNSPSGNDYHLLATAPAVDTGQTLAAVPIDLDGNPRPIGFSSDVGCYEYPIRPTAVTALALSPSVVSPGGSTTVTVTLNGGASVGGQSVGITVNRGGFVVPATVIVPAGTNNVTFTVATTSTANGTANITASAGGKSKTASLTVHSRIGNPHPAK